MDNEKKNAIFFDDLKEEAQKRLITDELFDSEDDGMVVTFTIDHELYGYNKEPKKQMLLQLIHALIIEDGMERNRDMMWDCMTHQFVNYYSEEDQKDETK